MIKQKTMQDFDKKFIVMTVYPCHCNYNEIQELFCYYNGAENDTCIKGLIQ